MPLAARNLSDLYYKKQKPQKPLLMFVTPAESLC